MAQGEKENRPIMIIGLKFIITNCLIATPTHDAYLDNGADTRLTVGTIILACPFFLVNNLPKYSKKGLTNMVNCNREIRIFHNKYLLFLTG